MTREQFCANYENWDNYKPLLWEGLERSSGLILELGVGKGSTRLLHDYAFMEDRFLCSYDSNEEWIKQFVGLASGRHLLDCVQVGAYKISDWDFVDQHYDACGLLFIDHAPGERRKVDIALFANKAQIIVAHDTEPNADHGYQMRDEIKKFKYWRDFETSGAWSSIMSNFIDVTKPL